MPPTRSELRFVTSVACVAVLGGVPAACGDDTATAATGSQGGGGQDGGCGTGGEDGCDLITQAETASRFFSVDAVGFGFTPSMGGAGPEVIVVSPNFLGAFGPGTYEIKGLDADGQFDGDFTVFAIEDAVVDLIGRDPADMDGRDFIGISGTVTIEEAPSYGTQFQGRIKGTLSNVKFVELTADFDVVGDQPCVEAADCTGGLSCQGGVCASGQCLRLGCAAFDAAGIDAACDAPTDVAAVPSGGSCFTDYLLLGHDCNPVTNEGCMTGEVCDYGANFSCYPLGGTEAALCGACENPISLCGVGLTCDSYGDQGLCFRYCCTDADCGDGANTCVAYYGTGVGVCLAGSPPG